MTQHWHHPGVIGRCWFHCRRLIRLLKHNAAINHLEHCRLAVDGGDLVGVVLEAHPALVAVLHHAVRVRVV